MTRAGIVADDLTGAADSAVQFARAGWRARLVLDDEAPAVPDAALEEAPDAASDSVTALVTDSRALDPAAAHAVTAAAVADLVRSGTDRVLVKIDSTMRGSVAQQVTGALEGWRTRHAQSFAVVSPAYPALGRTVDQGRLLVDGAGVETTSVGRDPVTPVTTSALAELLPGSSHVTVDGDARDLALRLVEASAAGADVVTVGAVTDADLTTTAQAVRLLGARAVPVGSAGLAVAVSRAWARDGDAVADVPADAPAGVDAVTGTDAATDADPGARPGPAAAPAHLVVVLSSLHDASRGQYEHLVAASGEGSGPGAPGVRTVAPTLDEVLAGDLGPALVRAGEPTDDDRIVVVLAPPRGTAGTDPTAAHQATPGTASGVPGPTTASGPTDAERVAGALAELTDRVVADLDDVGLVLVGGEGARAVLRRLGATSVRVLGAVREGVPHGTLEGGRLHGTPVVTKAGGFGPVTTLADVVPALLGHAGPGTDHGTGGGARTGPGAHAVPSPTTPTDPTPDPRTTARGDRS